MNIEQTSTKNQAKNVSKMDENQAKTALCGNLNERLVQVAHDAHTHADETHHHPARPCRRLKLRGFHVIPEDLVVWRQVVDTLKG